MNPKPKRAKQAPKEAKASLEDQHRAIAVSAQAAGLKSLYFIENRPDGTPLYLHECTLADVQRWKCGSQHDLSNLFLLADGRSALTVEAQRGLADVMLKVLNQWPRTKETANPFLERLYRDRSSPFRQRWDTFIKQGRRSADSATTARDAIDPLLIAKSFVASTVWTALIGCWVDAALFVSGDLRINTPSRDKDMFKLMVAFFEAVPKLAAALKSRSLSPWDANKAFLTHFDLLWTTVVEPWAVQQGKPHRWDRHLRKSHCAQQGMSWSLKVKVLKAALRRQLTALLADVNTDTADRPKRT